MFWKVRRVKVLVARSCLTVCNPMDCSPPGPSVHGILQASILEWAIIPFSRGLSQPRDGTQVSCIAGRFFTILSHQGSQVWGGGCLFCLTTTQRMKPSYDYNWKPRMFVRTSAPRSVSSRSYPPKDTGLLEALLGFSAPQSRLKPAHAPRRAEMLRGGLTPLPPFPVRFWLLQSQLPGQLSEALYRLL